MITSASRSIGRETAIPFVKKDWAIATYARNIRATVMQNVLFGRPLLVYIGLACILAAAFSVNLWFVAHDNRPPPWDYATYLSSSLRLYDALRQGSLPRLLAIYDDPYRPPLVPLAALPFYALFGVSYGSAMLANLVFITILVLSTYGLTKDILHSSWPALMAAGIVCSVPGVIAYGRVYGLDLPTTALAAAGLYLTVASRGFKIPSKSIALGVVIGLGMLTKWTYFVFVAPMIVLELFRYRRSVNLRNMVLSGLVAAGISSTWYIYALQQGLTWKLIRASWGTAATNYAPSPSMFDSAALLFYPRMLYDLLIGPFYVITLIPLFCTALLLALKKRPSLMGSQPAMSLAFSFLLPLFFFVLVENKSDRFLLPALSCLMVLLVSTAWRIQQGKIKIGPSILLVIVVAGSFISVIGSLQPSVGSDFGIYLPYTVSDQYFDYNDYSPPKPYDWKLQQVIELVGKQDPDADVGVLANHWAYNQDTLEYYALRLGFENLRFRDFRDYQVVPPYDDLNNYNFILLKTGGGREVFGETVIKIRERLRNPQDTFYANHEMIQSYDLPDGSQLFVFAKNTTSESPDTNLACARFSSFDAIFKKADQRERTISRVLLEGIIHPAPIPQLQEPDFPVKERLEKLFVGRSPCSTQEGQTCEFPKSLSQRGQVHA